MRLMGTQEDPDQSGLLQLFLVGSGGVFVLCAGGRNE